MRSEVILCLGLLAAQVGISQAESPIEALLTAREPENAISAAKQLRTTTKDKGVFVETLVYEARALWMLQEYESSIKVLEQIIANKSAVPAEVAYSYWLKGYCYIRLEKPASAIDAFSVVATEYQDSEKHQDSLIRLAFLAESRNDISVDERVMNFKKYLEQYPDGVESLQAKRSLAQLMWRQSEILESIEVKKEAKLAFLEIAEDHNSDEELVSWSHLNILALEMEIERLSSRNTIYVSGAKKFQKTSETAHSLLAGSSLTDSDRRVAQLVLGEAYYFDGDYSRAEATLLPLTISAQEDEVAPFARYMLGLNSLKKGDEAKAIEHFGSVLSVEKSKDFKGNNVRLAAMEWLGKAAKKQSDPSLVTATLSLIEAEDPDSKYMQRLVHTLKSIQPQEGGK